MSEENRTRRAVLAGVGAAGVIGLTALVAGCETYGGSTPTPGKELAKTSDIPVGGGKIFESDGIVVTQPEKDTFKAFSAICTHQSCPVSSVENGTINCTCHGSKFKVTDGSVVSGPAGRRLGSARITIEGDTIRLG